MRIPNYDHKRRARVTATRSEEEGEGKKKVVDGVEEGLNSCLSR